MASGRVLIVHGSGATRALMTELLTREGVSVEAVESTYRAMARFLDEPAQLLVLGLNGLREAELDLVRTLKQDRAAPKVIVSFPAALRDLAVRAVEAGADAYLLEPFYASEFTRLALTGLARPAPEAPPPSADLAQLAGEMAHAINNPLQILSLLLADPKMPKRKLTQKVSEELERIREVVRHLGAYGAGATAPPRRLDLRAVAMEAAEGFAGAVRVQPGPAMEAMGDEAALLAAMRSLFGALLLRAGPEGSLLAAVAVEGPAAAVTVEAPTASFAGETLARLRESVFVVREDRTVLPGLAPAHALLLRQSGSLEVTPVGETARFSLRLPRAS